MFLKLKGVDNYQRLKCWGENVLLNDDYGVYGKGDEGYAHYMSAFEESQKGPSGGGPRKNNNGNSGGCISTIILAILIYALIKAISG